MTATPPGIDPPARAQAGDRPALRRVLTIGVVLGLVVLVVLSSGVRRSEGPAFIPSLPVVPVASPTAGTARPAIDLPASIDATGGTDVTDAMQAFLDGVPDGSTIRMRAGALYRVDGTLSLTGRSDLEWDGSGATIAATTIVDTNRRNIYLKDSTWIRIHDLVIRGANPAPGVLDEAHQYEHGIWIDGGSDIEIGSVTIENPRGDCVYLGDADGTLPWAARVSFHDSICRGPGRNGVAIVAGREVRIDSNTFEGVGLHVVDIEPNRTDGVGGTEPVRPVQGAANVAVTGNRAVGPVPGYFFAANGWGTIDNLSVLDNVLEGSPLRITVQPLPDSGYLRTGVVVQGNRSDTPFAAADESAMRFTRNTDLTVRDNVGPLDGPGAVLIEVRDSCRIDIAGNQFPGGGRELQGEAGTCPVVTAAPRASVGDGPR